MWSSQYYTFELNFIASIFVEFVIHASCSLVSNMFFLDRCVSYFDVFSRSIEQRKKKVHRTHTKEDNKLICKWDFFMGKT